MVFIEEYFVCVVRIVVYILFDIDKKICLVILYNCDLKVLVKVI